MLALAVSYISSGVVAAAFADGFIGSGLAYFELVNFAAVSAAGTTYYYSDCTGTVPLHSTGCFANADLSNGACATAGDVTNPYCPDPDGDGKIDFIAAAFDQNPYAAGHNAIDAQPDSTIIMCADDAVNQIACGGTLATIRPSTMTTAYNSQNAWFCPKVSGTGAQPITISNKSGAQIVLDGDTDASGTITAADTIHMMTNVCAATSNIRWNGSDVGGQKGIKLIHWSGRTFALDAQAAGGGPNGYIINGIEWTAASAYGAWTTTNSETWVANGCTGSGTAGNSIFAKISGLANSTFISQNNYVHHSCSWVDRIHNNSGGSITLQNNVYNTVYEGLQSLDDYDAGGANPSSFVIQNNTYTNVGGGVLVKKGSANVTVTNNTFLCDGTQKLEGNGSCGAQISIHDDSGTPVPPASIYNVEVKGNSITCVGTLPASASFAGSCAANPGKCGWCEPPLIVSVHCHASDGCTDPNISVHDNYIDGARHWQGNYCYHSGICMNYHDTANGTLLVYNNIIKNAEIGVALRASNVILRDNIIMDSGTGGLGLSALQHGSIMFVGGQEPVADPNTNPANSNANQVYNNFVIRGGPGIYFGGGGGFGEDNDVIYNNTIYSPGGPGLGMWNGTVVNGMLFRNNMIWTAAPIPLISWGMAAAGGSVFEYNNVKSGLASADLTLAQIFGTNYSCSTLLTFGSNWCSNAVFVNAAGNDFHLRPTSAGINLGTSIGMPVGRTRDINNTIAALHGLPDYADNEIQIFSFWDIGADEYNNDLSPPTQPGSLSATAISSFQINLAWGASTDDWAVNGYEIWRSTTSGGPYTFVKSTAALPTAASDSPLNASTTYFYVVRAYDPSGNYSIYSNEASATTLAANSPPVANAGPDKSTPGGVAVTLNGSGTDSDGTIASYAWTVSPSSGCALSGAATANLTMTCTITGTYTATLTVTDNLGATATDSALVTVSNSPPVANAGPDQNVATGVAAILNGSGTDSDGTIASYAWTVSPSSGCTLSGAATANLTMTCTTHGTYTATLTVTDNLGATDTDSALVTVSNSPPVANAGPDQSVAGGFAVTLNGSGTDSDGTIASYAWTVSPSSGCALSGAATANLTMTCTSGGTYTATLTVTDNLGGVGSDTAQVTVTATNISPIANAGPEGSGQPGSTIVLSGSGFDLDGMIVSYQWFVSPSSGCTISGQSTPSLTISCLISRIYTATLTVTDNSGASSTDTTLVTFSNSCIP